MTSGPIFGASRRGINNLNKSTKKTKIIHVYWYGGIDGPENTVSDDLNGPTENSENRMKSYFMFAYLL